MIKKNFNVGLNRTGHMSFLIGQDWTPQFTGQVLLDWTESGLIFCLYKFYRQPAVMF